MQENDNAAKISAIVDEHRAAIETLDDDIMMEQVGVAMALDKLRGSLDMLEAHMDERELERASHAGYSEVAHEFVYLQRTLAGLQSVAQQKDAMISNIAQKANTAFEDVKPFVDERMKSSVKKAARLVAENVPID
jgi:hypothetical protein